MVGRTRQYYGKMRSPTTEERWASERITAVPSEDATTPTPCDALPLSRGSSSPPLASHRRGASLDLMSGGVGGKA